MLLILLNQTEFLNHIPNYAYIPLPNETAKTVVCTVALPQIPVINIKDISYFISYASWT